MAIWPAVRIQPSCCITALVECKNVNVKLFFLKFSYNERLHFKSELSATVCSDGKAECVKDLPALGGSLQDWKPGLYYGVDDQCRIAFGSAARACSFTNSDLVSHS